MRFHTPREAAAALRRGKVALVPTETVVGLVAGEAGLHRLNEIKGSDPGKPIALLCATRDQAFARAARVPPPAGKLADLYWPGSLTLVLDAPGGGTVGVRVPDHETVQSLLAAFGDPLYATSANLSGEPPPMSLEEVDPRIVSAVDAVVEGEPGAGQASAVVDLSGQKMRLLRPTGELTEDRLQNLADKADYTPPRA